MAKKNTAPVVKVTHTEMICWSLKHLESLRDDWAKKAERAKADNLFELVDFCHNELARIDPLIGILHQMYKFETGTEYCG